MTARNDITGDAIASKPASDSYRQNFDAIFKPDTSAATIAAALGLPDDLRDGETMTQWALRKQVEPGYTGWTKFPDCTGSCDSGQECRCKA